jgi:transposase InsO family protein
MRYLPVRPSMQTQGDIVFQSKEKKVDVDLDSGAQVCCISLWLARKLEKAGLCQKVHALLPLLQTVEGVGEVKNHGAYEITLRLRDQQGNTRTTTQLFACIRRPKTLPAILLSRYGCGLFGIVADFAINSFAFGKPQELSPLEAANLLLAGTPVYLATLSAVGLLPDDIELPGIDEPPDDDSDDLDRLPTCLRDYADVASSTAAKARPALAGAEHTIDLEPGKQPPYGPLYPLSERQLQELREYIEENLANGRITHSTSPAGSPILFVPKKDGTLRLCVDYRGLNKATIKNRYPLPLIGELMDRLATARFLSKVDLRDAYHRIAISPSDRWKTAFRTRYGHFEYTVMPFGLTNAPATFQAYMHKALSGLLDTICVVYLDDILIYSQTEEEHQTHLRQVFDRLREYELYVKLKKCEFFQPEVEFLGYIIGRDGVKMTPDRVKAIKEWPTPKTYRDVQVLLGFANFYRRFIAKYSHLVAPLTSLLKGSLKGVKHGDMDWGPLQQEAFEALQDAFQTAPILRHWDPLRETRVETDASTRAVSGILSQKLDDRWHPIAFWSRKLIDAENRWATGQQELLAIVESLEHWSHYLEGLGQVFTVLTDHQALKGVVDASPRDLRGRLARWVYRLSSFDFNIEHRPGATNPADALSRRPDYMEGEIAYKDIVPTLAKKLQLADQTPIALRAQVANLKVKREKDSPYHRWTQRATADATSHSIACEEPSTGRARKGTHQSRLQKAMTAIVAAVTTRSKGSSLTRPATASRDVDDSPSGIAGNILQDQIIPQPVIKELIEGETAWSQSPSADLYDLTRNLQAQDLEIQDWSAKVRGAVGGHFRGYTLDNKDVLWFKGRLVIPNQGALRKELLRKHHDDERAGHMGPAKTSDLLSRKFHWENMAEDVRQYVGDCELCLGARRPRHRPYGELQSLPLPEEPFQEISLDFITDLPACNRADGGTYDSILVIVDRFTKMAMFIPTVKRLNAAGLAAILYEKIECRFGTPTGIVSDRDKLLTSDFWKELCYEREIRRRLSTAYHPQTDGQTERTNQTIEGFLRKYCLKDPFGWAKLLPVGEFAYNNSKHSTIGVSPYEALYGYNPRMSEWTPKTLKVEGVHERLRRLEKTRRLIADEWEQAVKRQQRGYNKRHQPIEFSPGQWVGLSTRNFRTKHSKKVLPTYIRVRVKERVGKVAYRLTLPPIYSRLHDVFPVSLIEPWGRTQRIADPSAFPELLDDNEEWEVQDIIDHRGDGEVEGRKGKRTPPTHYLVKWEGWPAEYNTWEPADHLQNAQAIVQKYLKHRRVHPKWDDS